MRVAFLPRSQRAIAVAALLMLYLLGAGLVWYACTLPVYTDSSAPERISNELYSGHESLDAKTSEARFAEWFSRLHAYETPHKRLFDLGTGLVALAIAITWAIAMISRYLRLEKQRTLTAFQRIWTCLWLIRVPGAFWFYTVRLLRRDYPWWGDSIMIGIVFDSFEYLIDGLATLVLLMLLLRNRVLPAEITFTRPSSPFEWFRIVAITAWIVVLLYLATIGIPEGNAGQVISCFLASIILLIALVAPVRPELAPATEIIPT